LTFSVVSKPDWLTFTAGSSNGVLMGIPALANIGSNAIILKVNDGHSDALQGFTISVIGPSNIKNIDNSIVNNVFPNPASDFVNFNFSEIGKTRIDILDITGHLVKQIEADNEKLQKINISDLSNGLYIYKVYQNGKLSFGKFTKK
jgi:hypothetical protein